MHHEVESIGDDDDVSYTFPKNSWCNACTQSHFIPEVSPISRFSDGPIVFDDDEQDEALSDFYESGSDNYDNYGNM